MVCMQMKDKCTPAEDMQCQPWRRSEEARGSPGRAAACPEGEEATPASQRAPERQEERQRGSGGGRRSGAEAMPRGRHAPRRARTGLESLLALAMLGYGQGLETLPEAPERPRNETTRHDTLQERMERGRAGDAAGGPAGDRRRRLSSCTKKMVYVYPFILENDGKHRNSSQIYVYP